MDYTNLTPKQKSAIEHIVAYHKSNPDVPVQKIVKTLGIVNSTAYAASQRLGYKGIHNLLKGEKNIKNTISVKKRGPSKNRAKLQTLEVPEIKSASNVMVIVVPTDRLSEVLSQIGSN